MWHDFCAPLGMAQSWDTIIDSKLAMLCRLCTKKNGWSENRFTQKSNGVNSVYRIVIVHGVSHPTGNPMASGALKIPTSSTPRACIWGTLGYPPCGWLLNFDPNKWQRVWSTQCSEFEKNVSFQHSFSQLVAWTSTYWILGSEILSILSSYGFVWK